MSACPEDIFDFQAPDYVAIFRARAERLARIRANPQRLPAILGYYKNHIADFICDWGTLFEPRNPEIGLPSTIPFVLFPKQREWVGWVLDRWHGRQDGLTEKSRDSGMSWLAISVAASLCLFNDGLVIGFGSRKEEYVDKPGQPKSLFEKARLFLELLPKEFRGGWERDKHSTHMRIAFPHSGSYLTGEAGDNIGRGDRTSLYLLDEAAFLERPQSVEAALAATSNCRIYISTPNGSGNPFYDKRFSLPSEQVFTFHWRDDPRKGDEWYAKECAKLIDPVIIAQELDIDYMASVEGIIILQQWVQAAVDAHIKLGIDPSGIHLGALDVADEGKDLNAFTARHGILTVHNEEWSGKGSDIFYTTERAFTLCDEWQLTETLFDSDGLGAGVRAAAVRIADRRAKENYRRVKFTPYRGSAAVFKPEDMAPGTAVKNKDRFANAKAQNWFYVRDLFANTFRAVNGAEDYDPDSIISISSKIPQLQKLCVELSQAQWKMSPAGKILVDKVPDGNRSPNRADSLVMAYSPRQPALKISDAVFDQLDPRPWGNGAM